MHKFLLHIILLSLIGLQSLYGFDDGLLVKGLFKAKTTVSNATDRPFRFYAYTTYLAEKDLLGTWTHYNGCNQCPNITFTEDCRAVKSNGGSILETYLWRRANDTLFFIADSPSYIEFNDEFYLIKYTNEDNGERLELTSNRNKKITLLR